MSLHVRQEAMAEAEAAHSDSDPPTLLSSSEEEEEEEDEDEDLRREMEEPVLRPLCFSNDCPLLPANRELGFPHIVVTDGFDEEVDTSQLAFADGIATFLWRWDRVQFYRFFDLTKDKFEVHYGAPNKPIQDMLITRMGDTVMAGFRFRNGCGEMEWDPQLIFSIESGGKWIGRMCSEATRQEAIEGFGRSFARAIFFHALWEVREGSKVTVYQR